MSCLYLSFFTNRKDAIIPPHMVGVKMEYEANDILLHAQ